MKSIQKNLLAAHFFIGVLALGASPAFSQVSLSINIAPPPLQIDTQPACPDDGYIWTPGYWAYDDNTYTWVPGAWVQPPDIGDFWTPPYWGWDGGAFVFNAGYWGPNVGYYGGINYGYGYGGNGYGGGRWQGSHFSYNTAVNNVSSGSFHNTYVDRSAVNGNASRVSYNGGNGGVQAQPTAEQRQSSNVRGGQPSSAEKPEAVDHAPAPTEQKAESQQEPARALQPEHEQAPAQPRQEAQPQQPSHEQAPTQARPEAQAQQPSHEQAPTQARPAQAQQPAHPQAQAQPQAQNRGPGAPPDKKKVSGPQ